MLNEKQINQFKTKGVLIIKNFFSSEEIKKWDDEVLSHFNHPKDEDEWKNIMMKTSSSNFYLKNEPTPLTCLKMKALYSSLNRFVNWEGDNDLVVRPPDSTLPWLGARTPHLDFPVYDNILTLANSVFYLSDVTSKGAAFMYWPGSHIESWNYFKENPQDYMTQGDLSQDQVFEKIHKIVKHPVKEFIGNAGDLMIWHSLLLHSPSINKSNSTRKAVIGRWGEKIDKKRFDFNKSIWEYFNFK
ncbi:phytanoyl-CoA dioxygenase family protein [Aquimarina algiphila]|uniref:phytanoyl-CoA dioxygenase family protein n=1 Tax=Aquimarina algiphila TaxID=2047982 RepID=UPI00232C7CF9|nr:phytanoyl-CoA dioxygenase family protein [Aquimarina algiphila]